MKKEILLFLGLLLVGCTQTKFETPRYKYEYISPEESALHVVRQTPLNFVVPFAEEPYAQERVHYFFRELSKSTPSVIDGQINGERYYRVVTKRFEYSIRRAPSSGGYSYKVACIDRNTKSITAQSDINARNLSRFIMLGTFEKQAFTE